MEFHLATLSQIISLIIFRALENVEKDFRYRKLMTNLTHSGTFLSTINNIYLRYLLQLFLMLIFIRNL